MYYRLSDFYKRDVYFVFNTELNSVNRFSLFNSETIEVGKPLVYNVDLIDDYINKYDILPTFDAPLISEKLKLQIENLCDSNEIQFLNSIIIDKKNNQNNNFYVLNVLNTVPILDKEKSVFDVDEDNYYDIHKLYIKSNSLEDYSIVRMEEHKSYIIVTEEFKKRCESANLKGVEFIEEGHSIYTDI